MHPFTFIDSRYYFRIVFITLLFCFLVMTGMQWSEYGLQNETAPKGIITFELAKDMDTAQEIIASWREGHAMGYAGFNIGLDFLFLLTYATLIGVVIVLIASGFPEKHFFRRVGYMFSWIIILSALFDAVENVALINLLTDSMETYWVSIAYYCAILKFIGVGLGILYIVVGGIAHGIQRAIKGV